MPFLMPLYLQLVIGFTPLQSGLAMIPGALAAITGKTMITRLIRRFGFRNFLIANTLAIGAMFCSFSLIDAKTHIVLLLVQFFVFGIFNSMQFTAMNTVTLYDLEDNQTAAGNSMLSVAMQISSGSGVAMAAAILDGFSAHYNAAALPGQGERLMPAFMATFVCIGFLSIVTCSIFSQVPAGLGRETETRA